MTVNGAADTANSLSKDSLSKPTSPPPSPIALSNPTSPTPSPMILAKPTSPSPSLIVLDDSVLRSLLVPGDPVVPSPIVDGEVIDLPGPDRPSRRDLDDDDLPRRRDVGKSDTNKVWHFMCDGKQYGPVTEDELRACIFSGQVGTDELVWKPGMAQWARSSATMEFALVEMELIDDPAESKTRRRRTAKTRQTNDADEVPIETYGVVYRGGHPDYPKEGWGEIKFKLFDNRFELTSTMSTRKWFHGLVIPYDRVIKLEIVDRILGSIEGLIGGSNQQLNQKNNIHITYHDEPGSEVIFRVEMMTGITVMGQAKVCRQLQDRLRNHHILEKFRGERSQGKDRAETDIPAQIEKLAALRDKGIITKEEFETKKADLLSRM